MNQGLTITTALAAALVGGVFFAFSSFVMPALGRIPPAEGIRAMQRINIDVFHWSFMAVFLATPLLCTVLAIQAFRHQPGATSSYIVGAAALYWLGCMLVTAAGNVPLNNALADVDANAVDAASVWTHYVVVWTRWNHVRTMACLATAGILLVRLVNG